VAAAELYTTSEPAKAVDYFIRAGRAAESNSIPAGTAEQAARRGALLACNLYRSDANNCGLAKNAIANYCDIAGPSADPALEYFYANLLGSCGTASERLKLLGKIADSNSPMRDQARLDLLETAIRSEWHGHPAHVPSAIAQLHKIISGPLSDKAAQARAVTLLCETQLDASTVPAAQDVLETLSRQNEIEPALSNIYRCRAFMIKGDLSAAAKALLDSVARPGQYAPYAAVLIQKYAANIDCDKQGIEDVCTLAQKMADQPGANPDTLMAWAEIAAVAAQADNTKIAAVRSRLAEHPEMLSTLEGVRCLARLDMAAGKYPDAARKWASISETLGSRSDEPKPHSYRWWQAKYFEIECCRLAGTVSNAELAHTVEVLQSSFALPGPPWEAKLRELKASLN
jgi:hypothetical protein